MRHPNADHAFTLDSEPVNDPWSRMNTSSMDSKESWTLSYIDVLTLLLTLLVILLAYQKIDLEAAVSALRTDRLIPKKINEKPSEKPSLTPERIEPPITASQAPEDNSVVFNPKDFTYAGEKLFSLEALNLSFADHIDGTDIVKPSNADEKAHDNASLIETDNIDMTGSKPEKLDSVILLHALARDDNLDVSQDDRFLRIEFKESLLFPSGEADLKSEGTEILEKWATQLKQHSATILVEGHTDNQPIATQRYPSNWELSSSRATAVTRFFIDRGINPERVRAVGYADTRPRGDNNTLSGRQRNRRVSVVVQINDASDQSNLGSSQKQLQRPQKFP